MTTEFAMKIDEKWIQSIVSAEVQAALVRSLGGSVYSDTLDGIVRQALMQQVDYRGDPEKYPNKNTPTFVQHTVDKAIREVTKSAVIEAVEGSKERIKASVIEVLERKRDDIASSLVATLLKACESEYHIGVELKLTKDKE